MGRWAWGTSVLGALVGGIAPSAAADGYDVHACRMPSGAPIAEFAGWIDDTTGQPSERSCADATPLFGDAGFARWPTGLTRGEGEGVGVRFMAPAGTHIARAVLFRWFEGGVPPYGPGYTEYRLRADARMLESCHTASCPRRGNPFIPAVSGENRVAFEGLDAQYLSARIECPTYLGCRDDNLSAPPRLAIMASRITLVDDVPPQLPTPAAGSLFDASSPRTGEQSLRFHATDVGSGLASLAIVVDGSRHAEQRIVPGDARCGEPYTIPAPCPLEHRGTIAFDTGALANGSHDVQLAVRDVSGNEVVSQPIRIVTRNASLPNGAGASEFARVRAWLPDRGRRRGVRTVAFGTRARLAGRLLDHAARPIAGASLDVLDRPKRLGARWRRTTSLVTDARGRFRLRMPPGPSRKVRVAYRAYSGDVAYAATADATVRVRAGVRFRASPRRVHNGSFITFRGRVLGGSARAGVTVVIYAVGRRVRGERARVPVEAVRADFRGRFRYRYQFRNIAGPFHYRFQARVRADRGFPYAPGRSRVVHVAAVP